METILVVEDDPSIQRGLELNLQVEGYSVFTAADGETGLQKAIEHKPDVILLDVMLPKLSGFDLCRQLRKQGMTMPIIMLTAKTQEIDKIMGLELGADDYVTKPFSIAEVVARVNAHVRRSKRFETTEANYVFGPYTLDVKGQVLRKDGNQIELSQKEFQMLKLFLENEGKVLSRQEILTKVWGFDYFGTDRTVDNFINKLRQKVEDDINRPEHILTMRGSGYKFVR
ncbi:DNA-binding response regulator [bacterium]|nr:MAG: DNA-binding response regulator [bacterium]MBV6514663.1 Transcriptional regulatory protein WalR [Planctomycetota bacterium]NUO16943.1 response regulator transcription factor [Planctomycetaceae bacterium]MCQ3948616.1 DNA-binding response regulator [Planctomycetota bacterium]GIK52080.1 MAG: DNA-binding response regulator [Planctomycetota bacterium]